MNLQKNATYCFNLLKGFGKESFAVAILVAGIIFRCKGLIDGAQFVDLIKNIGMTYLASHTINSTWGGNITSVVPVPPNATVDDPDKGL
jgi:hypothetical protein